jgi:hypothetical protein
MSGERDDVIELVCSGTPLAFGRVTDGPIGEAGDRPTFVEETSILIFGNVARIGFVASFDRTRPPPIGRGYHGDL